MKRGTDCCWKMHKWCLCVLKNPPLMWCEFRSEIFITCTRNFWGRTYNWFTNVNRKAWSEQRWLQLHWQQQAHNLFKIQSAATQTDSIPSFHHFFQSISQSTPEIFIKAEGEHFFIYFLTHKGCERVRRKGERNWHPYKPGQIPHS